VEKEYYEIALKAYQSGSPNAATVGTCVIMIIVKDNLMYVAGCGDSSASIYSIKKSGQTKGYQGYQGFRLNNIHNASQKLEQEKILNKFPKEEDIIMSRNNSGVFYVKGVLQCTRSIGDMLLKYKEFNTPPSEGSSKSYRTLNNFNGPYINYLPEIKVYNITKNDEYLILASDGFWDLVNNKILEGIVSRKKSKQTIAKQMFDLCIEKAASDAHISTNELLSLEPGSRKRSIIDDITLMIVDLKNQVSNDI